MLRRLMLTIAALASTAASPSEATEAPAVAAASDLKFALPALAKAFEAETGIAVKLTFGSSGVLATQIANGAPFDVFMSADEKLVDDLNSRGALRDAGQLYALGVLSIFAPAGSAVTCDADLAGLTAALAAGNDGKLSIANPEHAPYGRAAKAALESMELWSRVQPQLVLGENAAQTLQFATDGGAMAALVPAPLVEAPEFKSNGCHARVSGRLAAPLRQKMGLVKNAGPAATTFAAFITSEKGRAILAKYGFSLPPST